MNDLNQIMNGVLYLTPRKEVFSTAYTTVRKKEGRILQDEEVLELPDTSKRNPNHKEWTRRKRSTHRFLEYLKGKEGVRSILDIGCGNGWFTNCLASIKENISVTGIDVNSQELEQAIRVFRKEHLEFVYGDLFEIDTYFENKFDIITLNATIQYFDDADALFTILKTYLKPNGEIHIIDSPFYDPHEIKAAKKRTEDYYTNIGVPEMSLYYFHHSKENISEFEIMYTPSKNLINRLLSKKDSPFMWLRYKRS